MIVLMTWKLPRDAWMRAAIAIWLVAMAAVGGRAILAPHRHTVYPIYSSAARDWLAGENVYDAVPRYDPFRYSPIAAVGFVPLSFLPDLPADLIWRLISLTVFLFALTLWGTANALAAGRDTCLLWLCAFPLALGSFANGQANLIVAGLILLAGVAAIGDRWTWAVIAVAAAGFLKLYPFALGFLFLLIAPRKFGPRFVIALLIGLALPLLFQRPEYVLQQYRLWLAQLRIDDRTIITGADRSCEDALLLCRLYQLRIDPSVYRVLQLIAGGLIGLLATAGRYAGWQSDRLIIRIVDLSCLWMLLFGPATEACTYVLMGPLLAIRCAKSLHNRIGGVDRTITIAAFVLCIIAIVAGAHPRLHPLKQFALLPHVALVLFITCITATATELIRSIPLTGMTKAGNLQSPLPSVLGSG